MRRGPIVLLAAIACLLPHPARADDAFETVGDVLLVAVPVGALAYGVHREGGLDNWRDLEEWSTWGPAQGGAAWAASAGITEGLKHVVDRRRPDYTFGDEQDSFPSGHTASAWSGPAYLRARYGIRDSWPWSGIAYALAITTAASRVEADRHHVTDVVASAVISELTASLLVGQYPDGPIPIISISDDRYYFGLNFRF